MARFRMSVRTPAISFTSNLHRRTEMRTESPKTVGYSWRLSSLALMRASRMASASAINTEQTKGRLVEPRQSTSPSTFVMIHPILPTFVISYQAPSVQHDGTEERRTEVAGIFTYSFPFLRFFYFIICRS